jgi:hypothetical protein
MHLHLKIPAQNTILQEIGHKEKAAAQHSNGLHTVMSRAAQEGGPQQPPSSTLSHTTRQAGRQAGSWQVSTQGGGWDAHACVLPARHQRPIHLLCYCVLCSREHALAAVAHGRPRLRVRDRLDSHVAECLRSRKLHLWRARSRPTRKWTMSYGVDSQQDAHKKGGSARRPVKVSCRACNQVILWESRTLKPP